TKTEVTLTATISKGSEEANKVFTVTVIQAPLTGNAKIYVDGGSVGFDQVTIADGQPSGGGGNPDFSFNPARLTVSQTTTGGTGADSSDDYTTIAITEANADSTYAIYQWIFGRAYDATTTTMSLKFSIRSAIDGVNKIKVKLEREGTASTPEIEMTFTADGDWQEVTYPLNTSTFGVDSPAVLADVWKVVFVLSDVNGVDAGIGAQSFDIDEVQFLITNADAGAVSAASNALEIGYTDGDNASNVTANVTLPTSGDNGVTISWLSSDAGFINTFGTVTRPAPTSESAVVTLTATISKGMEVTTKVFTVTVIQEPRRGAARIHADAAAVAGVLPITANRFAYGDDDASSFKVIVEAGGDDGSLSYLDVTEQNAGAVAGINWEFINNTYSLTAEDNTVVKFSVRVAAGGPTSFGVVLETPGGTGDDTRSYQVRKLVTFSADGTWQQVTIPVSDFISIANRDPDAGSEFRGSNFDPTSIRIVAFSLDEALAASSTAINIDVDEVQFAIVAP
ncbi:MAG: hypothetical protein K0U41_09535, partial [Gammaproteobacteria bacterium]|nr:hypothetical protein [Gammaproteobacteria bacterium]